MEINSCFHADAIYHILAHMDLKENASNLYSKQYIDHFKDIRCSSEDLEEKLKSLVNIYLDGFEKFAIINFLPFIVSNFEELQQALVSHSMYSDIDKQKFITPFLEIVDSEINFYYKDYWIKRTDDLYLRLEKLVVYLSFCKFGSDYGKEFT